MVSHRERIAARSSAAIAGAAPRRSGRTSCVSIRVAVKSARSCAEYSAVSLARWTARRATRRAARDRAIAPFPRGTASTASRPASRSKLGPDSVGVRRVRFLSRVYDPFEDVVLLTAPPRAETQLLLTLELCLGPVLYSA